MRTALPSMTQEEFLLGETSLYHPGLRAQDDLRYHPPPRPEETRLRFFIRVSGQRL